MGMKAWREHAADIFTKHDKIASKMKSAPGPVPSLIFSTPVRWRRCSPHHPEERSPSAVLLESVIRQIRSRGWHDPAHIDFTGTTDIMPQRMLPIFSQNAAELRRKRSSLQSPTDCPTDFLHRKQTAQPLLPLSSSAITSYTLRSDLPKSTFPNHLPMSWLSLQSLSTVL